MDLFKGRTLIIATKHHKEKVIAPILEANLEVNCFVDDAFNTDSLGTFSGEVKRELTPLETARKKCLLAMEHSNCDLGVASEGSFGPHPSLFFATADEEFLILIDKKNNFEIIGRELSTETNFGGIDIHTKQELLDFASQVQFPSHALILKVSKDSHLDMAKGITSQTELLNTFERLKKTHGSVYVETDMRAMNNPSRMLVIEKVCEKLIETIQSQCPQCQTPGFTVTDTIEGLPCDLCGTPTNSILSLIYQCKKCGYTEEKPNSRGVTTEDPMYCQFCNP